MMNWKISGMSNNSKEGLRKATNVHSHGIVSPSLDFRFYDYEASFNHYTVTCRAMHSTQMPSG
jgi:hypothetical protein